MYLELSTNTFILLRFNKSSFSDIGMRKILRSLLNNNTLKGLG